ncbi:MAG TPA: EAL domain-containing protein [Vicinamibacteria bacterium]|nr:EAL domain-containing protein [Vicinamibacteria bacterium]
MSEPIPPYHERIPELAAELAERGCLGVIVLDTSALTSIEEAYGSDAYDEVRRRTFKTLAEQRGKDYRSEDILCLDKPRGHNFIIFLERKRRRNHPPSVADLKAVRTRMISSLAANLGRAAFPYIKTPPLIEVGYGMAVYNPLLHAERILRRAVLEALETAAHSRRGEELVVREKLQDLILRERVVTAYQAIMELKDRTVLGFEALSRGARGTGLESAYALFGAAEEHGLLVELDRLCRRRALLSSGRIPSNAKIFVNTLPATIRDPQFRGKALIDFLDRAQVSPDRIVIEITERLVIDNYNLFREAMAYFTDLGMSFAVDDVGAGYSGLESIARLKPHYLKIDISLVRDVHVSLVNREMVKAIIAMGHGIGAAVIAEGIHTEDEALALQTMGIDWGQGYLLARPDPGPEPVQTA